MRRKLAQWLRRLAEWLAPTPPTPVDVLMPLARSMVLALQDMPVAGSTKWLRAMKEMERITNARRRHINAAIDRAVLELDGD
jgi:hypothetical protein